MRPRAVSPLKLSTAPSTWRPNVIIGKTFRFEAAHQLMGWPEVHKCRGLHGHSYKVDVAFQGPVNRHDGCVIDFANISSTWRTLIFPRLDHKFLNEVCSEANPTAEFLAEWIATAFRQDPVFRNGGVRLVFVRVWETEDAYAEYRA